MTDEVREAMEWIESYEEGDNGMADIAEGISQIAIRRAKAGDHPWKAVREITARMAAGDENVFDWEALILDLKAALARIS